MKLGQKWFGLEAWEKIREMSKPVSAYFGGWFTRIVMGRVNTENNCLIIIEGETGSGKSCFALNLAQHYDPYFSAKRIAFTGSEFLNLLSEVPSKGWIVWDEAGVNLSHRKWQSEINIAIMQVIQSFRYKFINVIFTLPSAQYLDKVPREMCHFVIRMVGRGQGTVYRIVKSPYEGWTFTPFLGTIHSEMPTNELYYEFKRLHAEHQEKLYEQSRKQMEVSEKKMEEKLEKAFEPRETFDSLKEKGLLILPQIVNVKKDTDQGLISVIELQRKLNLPHNKAYDLRRELLKELHYENDKLLNELRRQAS